MFELSTGYGAPGGGGTDNGFLPTVIGICLCVSALTWLSGRAGWPRWVGVLTVLVATVVLTAVTLGWLIESPYLMFVPQGQSMMHAGGAALAIIAANAVVVGLIWLTVLIGLRAVGLAGRRGIHAPSD